MRNKKMLTYLVAAILFSSVTSMPRCALASQSSSHGATRLAFFGGWKAKQKSPLNKRQKTLARTMLSSLEKGANLAFFSESDGCRECDTVKNLLDDLTSMSPLLSVETLSLIRDTQRAAELGIDKVPGIAILDSEKNNSGIRYYGAPLGFEFEAFLQAIVNTAHHNPGLQPDTMAGLSLVKKPVTITIFVAQH